MRSLHEPCCTLARLGGVRTWPSLQSRAVTAERSWVSDFLAGWHSSTSTLHTPPTLALYSRSSWGNDNYTHTSLSFIPAGRSSILITPSSSTHHINGPFIRHASPQLVFTRLISSPGIHNVKPLPPLPLHPPAAPALRLRLKSTSRAVGRALERGVRVL